MASAVGRLFRKSKSRGKRHASGNCDSDEFPAVSYRSNDERNEKKDKKLNGKKIQKFTGNFNNKNDIYARNRHLDRVQHLEETTSTSGWGLSRKPNKFLHRGMDKLRRSIRQSLHRNRRGSLGEDGAAASASLAQNDRDGKAPSKAQLKHQQSSSSRRSSADNATNGANSGGNSNRPAAWQQDETSVRAGTCVFNVKYLGCVEVFESRGMQVCEEALKVLRSQRRRPIGALLYISGDGLRVVDSDTNRGLLVDQTIEKVSFCAPDRHNDKGFAYICRDGTTRRWMCHGFAAGKTTGERLSHAVGCAFAVCLEKKQRRDREVQPTVTSQNGQSNSQTTVTQATVTQLNDDTSVAPNRNATATASFRHASLVERKLDPQSVIVVSHPAAADSTRSPTPSTGSGVGTLPKPRPQANPLLFERGGSLRAPAGTNINNAQFKRQVSLRAGQVSDFAAGLQQGGGTKVPATIMEELPCESAASYAPAGSSNCPTSSTNFNSEMQSHQAESNIFGTPTHQTTYVHSVTSYQQGYGNENMGGNATQSQVQYGQMSVTQQQFGFGTLPAGQQNFGAAPTGQPVEYPFPQQPAASHYNPMNFGTPPALPQRPPAVGPAARSAPQVRKPPNSSGMGSMNHTCLAGGEMPMQHEDTISEDDWAGNTPAPPWDQTAPMDTSHPTTVTQCGATTVTQGDMSGNTSDSGGNFVRGGLRASKAELWLQNTLMSVDKVNREGTPPVGNPGQSAQTAAPPPVPERRDLFGQSEFLGTPQHVGTAPNGNESAQQQQNNRWHTFEDDSPKKEKVVDEFEQKWSTAAVVSPRNSETPQKNVVNPFSKESEAVGV